MASQLVPGILLAEEPDVRMGAGFESNFDGALKNQKCDPSCWKVENGTLISEAMPDQARK